MKKYKIVVEQRNVFYEHAASEVQARLIVLEERIWDEHQSGEDTYDFEITVEEEDE